MLFNYKLFYRVYYFLLLLILITAGGTSGYMLIEEWGFVDSFYMTIITISTVGFREVGDLSVYGKLFTAFLIMSSFGTFAYAITSITTYLVGGEYRRYFKEYKTMTESKKMKNHVIICGYGRVGKQVAQDLLASNEEFVVIEMDDEIVSDSKMTDQFLCLKGNGTDDETLEIAGIKNARAIITCLPKDADNIYVVLASREANEKVLIVSRASDVSAVSKLRIAGANNVIMPDTIGGSHMASLISSPDVMEFLDIIRVQGFQGSNIETISYDELPGDLKDQKIRELEAREITGVTIIGYRSPDGEYIINPSLDTEIHPGSRIFVLGNEAQVKKLKEHFGLSHNH